VPILKKGANGVHSSNADAADCGSGNGCVHPPSQCALDRRREVRVRRFHRAKPEAGDLIPGSGGVRKVRWGRQGSVKRGGVRIIYFYHHPAMPLYLLMIYAKARRDDLSPDARRTVQG